MTPSDGKGPVAVEIESFCELVSPRLVGVLTLHCDDRETAEELTQEALVRAWERWDSVSVMNSPEGWTFRVALNMASSLRRREQAARRAYRRLTPSEPPGESGTVDRVLIQRALAKLPPRQRAAVTLRYYGRLSVAEAAVALDCAPGTVKSLCSQALAALRKDIGSDLTTTEMEVSDA